MAVQRAVAVGLAVVAVAAVLAYRAGYLGSSAADETAAARVLEPVAIDAATAQLAVWDNRIEAVGTLRAVNGADLTTEMGGTVTAIHFESGQKVNKGDLLVTLDTQAEEGDLARLQAQAKLAELDRQRREQLLKEEAISKADYDAAVAEATAARAAVTAQQGRIGLKQIRAPFSGELGIRRVSVGQFVTPATPVVTLQSLDPVDIDFGLSEQYVASVDAGFDVAVQIDAQPQKIFRGKVLAVEPRIAESTRNFSVRARLPNPEGVLRAGQLGRVILSLPGERELLSIPASAIHEASYGASVFVVQPSQDSATGFAVVQRFIQLGEKRADIVAVAGGLKAGEQVAISGLRQLRNQQPVTVNPAAGD